MTLLNNCLFGYCVCSAALFFVMWLMGLGIKWAKVTYGEWAVIPIAVFVLAMALWRLRYEKKHGITDDRKGDFY